MALEIAMPAGEVEDSLSRGTSASMVRYLRISPGLWCLSEVKTPCSILVGAISVSMRRPRAKVVMSAAPQFAPDHVRGHKRSTPIGLYTSLDTLDPVYVLLAVRMTQTFTQPAPETSISGRA